MGVHSPIELLYVCRCWCASKAKKRISNGKEKKEKKTFSWCARNECAILRILIYFIALNVVCRFIRLKLKWTDAAQSNDDTNLLCSHQPALPYVIILLTITNDAKTFHQSIYICVDISTFSCRKILFRMLFIKFLHCDRETKKKKNRVPN